jgi:hypothetical protein
MKNSNWLVAEMKEVECTNCGKEVTEDKVDVIDTPFGCDIVCKEADSCPNWKALEGAAEKDAEDKYYREGRYARLTNPYGR